MWRSFFNFVIDQLFPKTCFGCGVFGFILCEACCFKVEVDFRPEDLGGLRVWSAFHYHQSVVPRIVSLWKYSGNRAVILRLLELIDFDWDFYIDDIDYIVAVPLHRHRLVERGFNQALQLAKVLGDFYDVPVLTSLKRVRSTKSQAKLSRSGRLENLKGAFVWKGESLAGARVLLVDDVVTTGSTLREAVGVLRDAGARDVQAWCLFRGGG